MSQVVSLSVTGNYDKASAEFRNLISEDSGEEANSTGKDFEVFYDELGKEIRCEGDYPDSVFSSLVKIKLQYGGKLLYEGEEWIGEDEEEVDQTGVMGKILIVLALIFFPLTIVYLLLRALLWLPYKLWKATK